MADLGQLARLKQPERYAEGFAMFYVGGEEAFGLFGPDPEELLEVDLWLVCDRWRTAAPLPALEHSAIRPWKIEAIRGAGRIDATCPVTGETACLATVRRPAGDCVPGRFLVARSVPREGGTHALLGRVPVVDARAQDDFKDLLEQLSSEVRQPFRLWFQYGGEIAAAAWNWPEEREHTREGEIVQEHHVAFALPDPERAIRALDADGEFARTGQKYWDANVIAWHWLAGTPAPAVEMPDELGVEWRLCREDADDQPWLAELDLNLYERDIWLFAPSARRLEHVERELVRRFEAILGEIADRRVETVQSIPRWKQERIDRISTGVEARRLSQLVNSR